MKATSDWKVIEHVVKSTPPEDIRLIEPEKGPEVYRFMVSNPVPIYKTMPEYDISNVHPDIKEWLLDRDLTLNEYPTQITIPDSNGGQYVLSQLWTKFFETTCEVTAVEFKLRFSDILPSNLQDISF